MLHIRRLWFLALAGLLAGCAPAETPPPEDETDEQAVREELSARMDAYGEAALAGDANALVGFWTEDARLWEPGMDMDRSEIGAFLREFLQTGRVTSFEIEPFDVFVHGDAAYDFGRYDEVLEIEGETQEIRGYYAARWERGADGVWRIDRLVAGPRDAPEGM